MRKTSLPFHIKNYREHLFVITMSLPNAPIERIIRKAGAERVSEDAVEELKSAVNEAGEEIAQEAVEMSDHANRKTIKKEDIELATK